LFLSPWIFNYPVGAQSQNALVTGIIAVLSAAALAAFTVWEEVINLIAGLWLIVSPWVSKFEHATAMRVNIVIEIIVVVLAAIELWSMWQSPPRQVANR
jgi:SPW repeat